MSSAVVIAMGATVALTDAAQLVWSLTKPYHSPTAQIGGNEVLGSIQIVAGSEGVIASRALLMALQEMDLSVTSPKLKVDGIVPADKTWSTDIAPLPIALINRYNAGRPQAVLPPAQYGVSYTGVFSTAAGRFRYSVSARLFQRGTLSGWSRVDDSRYAGQYFVEHLVSLVSNQLDKGGAILR